MTSSITGIDTAAEALLEAEQCVFDRGPITAQWPGLDLAAAYAVQERTLARRLERGEDLVGIKLGLTSVAKQQQMNVAEPIVAFLTDAMILPSGEPVPQSRLIHPRAEPEIVFTMGADLSGAEHTAESVASAVATVHGGIEIIDSRFQAFSFTLCDVVADNASSASFAVGETVLAPAELDMAAETCEFEIDGKVVGTATGADTLGHPLHALAIAANMLHARGWSIRKDWIVLTGGLTDAFAIPAGSSATARFAHLGTVTVNG